MSILSKPAVRIQHYTIIKILGDLIVSAEEGNGSSSSSDGVKMTTSATTTTTTGGIISTTVLEFLDVFCRRLKANVVYDAQVGVKDRQHGSSSKQHPHHHHNVNGEGVDDVKNGLVELIGKMRFEKGE